MVRPINSGKKVVENYRERIIVDPDNPILAFKASKQGSSKIYLEYSQPWDGGEKEEWTCTVNVIAK